MNTERRTRRAVAYKRKHCTVTRLREETERREESKRKNLEHKNRTATNWPFLLVRGVSVDLGSFCSFCSVGRLLLAPDSIGPATPGPGSLLQCTTEYRTLLHYCTIAALVHRLCTEHTDVMRYECTILLYAAYERICVCKVGAFDAMQPKKARWRGFL